MENNLENKAGFLTHVYADSRLAIKSILGSGITFGIINILNEPKEYYAELTPLSAITDEDAIEVANLMDWEQPKERDDFREIRDQIIVKIKHKWVTWVCVDFLRSKSYYVGDGTEIEYGWVKLKEA